jgi:hypothetical protein
MPTAEQDTPPMSPTSIAHWIQTYSFFPVSPSSALPPYHPYFLDLTQLSQAFLFCSSSSLTQDECFQNVKAFHSIHIPLQVSPHALTWHLRSSFLVSPTLRTIASYTKPLTASEPVATILSEHSINAPASGPQSMALLSLL